MFIRKPSLIGASIQAAFLGIIVAVIAVGQLVRVVRHHEAPPRQPIPFIGLEAGTKDVTTRVMPMPGMPTEKPIWDQERANRTMERMMEIERKTWERAR